jgi:hypothetical protein
MMILMMMMMILLLPHRLLNLVSLFAQQQVSTSINQQQVSDSSDHEVLLQSGLLCQ